MEETATVRPPGPTQEPPKTAAKRSRKAKAAPKSEDYYLDVLNGDLKRAEADGYNRERLLAKLGIESGKGLFEKAADIIFDGFLGGGKKK